MSLRSWGVAFRDAIRSITQSSLMSLASVATVAVSLLVLSVVFLLAVNLEFMANSVEQQVEIKAYLCSAQDQNASCEKKELEKEEKESIIAQVQALPDVKEVVFVSREQALEKMKEQFGEQKDILEGLEGENPLRDSLEIKVVDTKQVKSVAEATQKVPGISNVNYGQEYVEKLLAFTRAVRVGGIGLVLMLVVATVLTLSNTIRLAVYARRREISIMKLVGATDWYIRRPFMLEGVFLGVLGASAALAITGAGYLRVVAYVHRNVPFLPMVPAGELLFNLVTGMVVLGGVLGAMGSLVSMRRFLKV